MKKHYKVKELYCDYCTNEEFRFSYNTTEKELLESIESDEKSGKYSDKIELYDPNNNLVSVQFVGYDAVKLLAISELH